MKKYSFNYSKKDIMRTVCEFSIRLINSIASDYYGRSFLLENNVVVKILIKILKK